MRTAGSTLRVRKTQKRRDEVPAVAVIVEIRDVSQDDLAERAGAMRGLNNIAREDVENGRARHRAPAISSVQHHKYQKIETVGDPKWKATGSSRIS